MFIRSANALSFSSLISKQLPVIHLVSKLPDLGALGKCKLVLLALPLFERCQSLRNKNVPSTQAVSMYHPHVAQTGYATPVLLKGHPFWT